MDIQDLNTFRLACIVILATEIGIGTIGNIVSIIVWNSGRKSSIAACATYFKIIAVTDICVLLVPALKFLLDLSKISLSHAHVVLCKAFGFSELFGPQVSAWLVVCITVERTLSLCFPLQFQTKGARKRAYISTVLMIITAAGLNSFELVNRTMFQFNQTYENGLLVNKSRVFCVTILTEEYEIMRSVSFIWFLGLLPFALVTACNSIIVVRIFMMRKICGVTGQHPNNAVSFTKICFAIGILYCISALPLMLHSLNLFKTIEIIKINTNTYIAFRMFAYTCLYLNNSLNFFLYCFTGAKFRKDLQEMFQCLKPRRRRSQHLISVQSKTSVLPLHRSVYTLNQNSNDNNASTEVSLTSFSGQHARNRD